MLKHAMIIDEWMLVNTLECDTKQWVEKRRLPTKFEINRIERTGHSIFYSIIYIWGEVAWSRLQTRASFRVVTFESTRPTTLETASGAGTPVELSPDINAIDWKLDGWLAGNTFCSV